MSEPAAPPTTSRGKWMALTAALLGWMFDGLEMGLFPLAARPALRSLLEDPSERNVGLWFGIATAAFLVGAATGGVVFGWLGDRIGRVRAMMLSVLTYAGFTGLGYFFTAAWQIPVLRFLAALGMGGEWSLGVALVNEIWPERSRAFLAGLIGAAANVGFLTIGVVSMLLPQSPESWRLLMVAGATPALLTFFIRLFVPESQKWEREKTTGATSHWATRDLIGVLIGAAGACFIIVLWAVELPLVIRITGSLIGLALATGGFIYPVLRYLQRAGVPDDPHHGWKPTIRRMLLGACLGGVALLGTWGSMQWAPSWADELRSKGHTTLSSVTLAKEWTQICMASGAILATILAAFLGDWLGRRPAYLLLCILSLLSVYVFFQWNNSFGIVFLISVFLAGGITSAFYGWLPLYLPELFRTAVRATGQGFSFNFGRIIAAVGALQTGALMQVFDGSYPRACTIMSLIYVVGIVIIWFVPETKGKPLPD